MIQLDSLDKCWVKLTPILKNDPNFAMIILKFKTKCYFYMKCSSKGCNCIVVSLTPQKTLLLQKSSAPDSLLFKTTCQICGTIAPVTRFGATPLLKANSLAFFLFLERYNCIVVSRKQEKKRSSPVVASPIRNVLQQFQCKSNAIFKPN